MSAGPLGYPCRLPYGGAIPIPLSFLTIVVLHVCQIGRSLFFFETMMLYFEHLDQAGHLLMSYPAQARFDGPGPRISRHDQDERKIRLCHRFNPLPGASNLFAMTLNGRTWTFGSSHSLMRKSCLPGRQAHAPPLSLVQVRL